MACLNVKGMNLLVHGTHEDVLPDSNKSARLRFKLNDTAGHITVLQAARESRGTPEQ